MYYITFKNSRGEMERVATDCVTVTCICPICGKEYEGISLHESEPCIVCEEERERAQSEFIRTLMAKHQGHAQSPRVKIILAKQVQKREAV